MSQRKVTGKTIKLWPILLGHYKEQSIILEQIESVKPSDFIGYRAGGEAHKLYKNGNSTLRCIVVDQRLPLDVTDYPNQKNESLGTKA